MSKLNDENVENVENVENEQTEYADLKLPDFPDREPIVVKSVTETQIEKQAEKLARQKDLLSNGGRYLVSKHKKRNKKLAKAISKSKITVKVQEYGTFVIDWSKIPDRVKHKVAGKKTRWVHPNQINHYKTIGYEKILDDEGNDVVTGRYENQALVLVAADPNDNKYKTYQEYKENERKSRIGGFGINDEGDEYDPDEHIDDYTEIAIKKLHAQGLSIDDVVNI